ncbi:golvesin C-terminal-like domain-containing protein [Actinoplanes subglobosus]|uniref:Golvesin/Xly CBD-like domain-containing protein n=1 Tax=Actinoplanes subglobosus TaxID=1547892 RepID=A0ABV8ITF3_9ACTN
MTAVPAQAQAPTPAPAPQPTAESTPDDGDAAALAKSKIPTERRSELLAGNWRKSTDEAWTTSGDETGFHLLMATAASGYEWRTVATLREPGIETDRWIGNVCLTQSGRKAVVVYAPRAFTNKEQLFDRGAFTAVVDTRTGAVTKLPVRASIAYFDPGCGAGEQAVITQARGAADPAGDPATRLVQVDAATGKVGGFREFSGQVTSAIPAAPGTIVAAAGKSLIAVDAKGKRRTLTRTATVPYRLTLDSTGGLLYLEAGGKASAEQTSTVRRLPSATAAGRPTDVASGPLTRFDLRAGTGRRAFIVGQVSTTKALPSGVRRVNVPSSSELSTNGELAIMHADRPAVAGPQGQMSKAYADSMTEPDTSGPDAADQVDLSTKIVTTGRTTSFEVQPGVRPAAKIADGAEAHPLNDAPAAVQQRVAAAAGSAATNTVDAEAWCSVPRNDPMTQAYQPTGRQVEWAADQAVVGNLTTSRPANWKGSGLPSYSPQGLFPPLQLTDGGRVPVQIFLGILAQESNLWQASGQVLPGSTGNPLIGNYYGRKTANADTSDDWIINFEDSDCGYGLTQITDGMRKAEHPKPGEKILTSTQQRAAALDYTANLAGGLRILQSKWNILKAKGLLPKGNFDPKWLESWFMPVWAYNSGLQPSATTGNTSGCDPGPTCTDAKGNWGLGWGNNPANPNYDPGRKFFNANPRDASHPQDWPYPEKVIGWAAFSIATVDGPGFRPSWWMTEADRLAAKPERSWFCMPSANRCDLSQKVKPTDPAVSGDPAGPCLNTNAAGQYDLHCWWHEVGPSYRSCGQVSCGNELLRFDTTYPEQPDGTHNEPNCSTAGLPAGAMVIDNLPDSVPSVRRLNNGSVCNRPASAGTFGLQFATDSRGAYVSKVDFHQRGAGFGGHIWYGFTHAPDADGQKFGVTGTWKLNKSISGPAQILVHIPDTGSSARVRYDIKTAKGVRTRTISQESETNRWVPLGAFMFDAAPEISLSNLVNGGNGDGAVAWDAVAVVPINGTYVDRTVDAVAFFDERQNINMGPFAPPVNTPLTSHQTMRDWAMRMASPLAAIPSCRGATTAACMNPAMEAAMQKWYDTIVQGGTDPANSPPGTSIPAWLGFSNKYTYRPTSENMPAYFMTDDASYKIRAQAQVSFIKTADGKIVSGSESVEYDHRTADTHLPAFILETFHAITKDYGIAPPDLTYSLADLNAHDGLVQTASPQIDGVLPGRSYAYAGHTPVITDLDGNATADGSCVAALFTSGGSIGYRPMLGVSSVTKGYEAWVQRLKSDPRVPTEVHTLAAEIFNLFFKPGVDGSLMGQATPIWQELNFRACADGTIRKNSNRPVLRASLMPSQYLYVDGKAMNADGAMTGSASPVWTGDFSSFSNFPDPNVDAPLWKNGYGPCGPATDKSGNPWDMTAVPPADPNVNPRTAHFCVDANLASDPDYSSR